MNRSELLSAFQFPEARENYYSLRRLYRLDRELFYELDLEAGTYLSRTPRGYRVMQSIVGDYSARFDVCVGISPPTLADRLKLYKSQEAMFREGRERSLMRRIQNCCNVAEERPGERC